MQLLLMSHICKMIDILRNECYNHFVIKKYKKEKRRTLGLVLLHWSFFVSSNMKGWKKMNNTKQNTLATAEGVDVLATMPTVTQISIPEISVNATQAVITSNIDEIVSVATSIANELANTTFVGETAEQTLTLIRKNRAKLNKVKEAMEDKRKSLKKEILKPYSSYESKQKDCNAVIDNALQIMDKKIETLDNQIRDIRRAEIRQFYDENTEGVGDFKEELYSKIYDSAWEKSSVKAYKEGITVAVKNYLDGMVALEMMTGDFQDEAITRFKETLNLSETLAFLSKKRQEKERLLAAERERIEREAQRKAQAEIEAARKQAEAEKEAERKAMEKEMAQERERIQREAQEKILEERKNAEASMDSQSAVANEHATESSSVKPDLSDYVPVHIHKDDWPAAKLYLQKMMMNFITE